MVFQQRKQGIFNQHLFVFFFELLSINIISNYFSIWRDYTLQYSHF